MEKISKYNTGRSLDPRTMGTKEFAIAAREWAEGSRWLWIFLWFCRIIGVITAGSHIGKNLSYIDLDVSVSPRKFIMKMVNSIQRFRNTQLMFMTDGGNPLSGPRWYIPNISLDVAKEANPDVLFKQLICSIANPVQKETPFGKMMQLYDILANSQTFMDVRLMKKDGSNFILTFEFWKGPRADYLVEYFSKFGFNKTRYAENAGPLVMLFKGDEATISEKIDEIVSEIKKSFNPPKTWNHEKRLEHATFLMETEGMDAVNAYISELRKA